MLPDFFRGRVALWFSKSTMDSLSRSLATCLAAALLIRLLHLSSGAAGYGFSKRPISNLTRSSLDTAVLTVAISSLPDLTSSGIFWKLLLSVSSLDRYHYCGHDILQRTTSHLNVNSGSQELCGNRGHIDGVALAHLEGIAESVTAASICHHEIVIAPFLSQDLSKSMVV